MKDQIEFSFGSDAIASAYDNVLVPSLFAPWAHQIIQENQPWKGKSVLDLACGTGAVTRELAQNVSSKGKVIGLDINLEMLNVAKINCAEWGENIEFVVGSCESLPVSSGSLDTVVCQQGFQFFPDKKAAASEIHRVLKPGGTAILSTWCSVSECEIFGVICDTLESMGENEISGMIRVPFDFMSPENLSRYFKDEGFLMLSITRHERDLRLEGGLDGALNMVYATPIGPKLNELSGLKQDEFRKLFSKNVQRLGHNGSTFGRMVTNILKVMK